MTKPVTKAWHAWLDLMPGVQPTLYLAGHVRTGAGNRVPKLAEAVPQGTNPAILILDLSIQTEGQVGTDDYAFRPATFHKTAGKGEYAQVEVRYEGDQIALLDIETVH